MGRNFYLAHNSKEYHIGKKSCGWKFIFDLDLFRVLPEDDPRWKFFIVYWDRITLYNSRLKEPAPSEPIYTLTENDVWDILKTYKIVDEYGDSYSFNKLFHWTKDGNESLMDNYTYFMKKRSPIGYDRDFTIGKLLFTGYTDFC